MSHNDSNDVANPRGAKNSNFWEIPVSLVSCRAIHHPHCLDKCTPAANLTVFHAILVLRNGKSSQTE
jgi:hypothetical protein